MEGSREGSEESEVPEEEGVGIYPKRGADSQVATKQHQFLRYLRCLRATPPAIASVSLPAPTISGCAALPVPLDFKLLNFGFGFSLVA